METTINRRIAILVYEDLEAAFTYLGRVFGFGPGEMMRDPEGNVVHAEIQAGDGDLLNCTRSPRRSRCNRRSILAARVARWR